MKKTTKLVNFRNFHTNHHLPRDLENKIFGFLPSVLIFVAKKGSFKCWKTMTGALKKFILSRSSFEIEDRRRRNRSFIFPILKKFRETN